jgi:hypothetical protein
VSDGWFVVNTREAAWLTNDSFGARCVFEADKPVIRARPDLEVHRFADVGLTLCVLPPGTGHVFVGAGDSPCSTSSANLRVRGASLPSRR